MTTDIQPPLIPDLPMDNPDAYAKKENPFQEQIVAIMQERGLRDADVVKATGIPWGTWMGWVYGDVSFPIAGDQLKKLHTYLNLHVEFILWGMGTDEPVYKDFESEPKDCA